MIPNQYPPKKYTTFQGHLKLEKRARMKTQVKFSYKGNHIQSAKGRIKYIGGGEFNMQYIFNGKD